MNGPDSASYSPAIAALSGSGPVSHGLTDDADATAGAVSWFSALDASSAPISATSRPTGFSDVDSLAQAILDKLGTPG